MKNSSLSIKKKFKKILIDVENLKEDSVKLWNDVHIWNSKNDSELRTFENILLNKFLTDLRIIQNEHIIQLENSLDLPTNKKSK
jgi:phage pi2 protein 07